MQSKVVITGHAAGLGQALARRFEEHDYLVSGWDIAINNEHDLLLDSTIDLVVKDCEDAAIFVNNARPRQVDYLQSVHDSWSNQPRLIINIGSNFTCWTEEQISRIYPNQPNLLDYHRSKVALDQCQRDLYIEDLFKGVIGPYMILIKPSIMDTENNANISLDKLSVEHVTDMIFQAIANANNNKFLLIEFAINFK